MSALQIVVILICAAFGFGIVSNVIGSTRKPGPTEQDDVHDRDEN